MSELDDHDVVGLHGVDDLVEAAFAGVGARGAAADGFVDDVEGQGVGEVDAPACLWIVLVVRFEGSEVLVWIGITSCCAACSCHGRVAGEVDCLCTLGNFAGGCCDGSGGKSQHRGDL